MQSFWKLLWTTLALTLCVPLLEAADDRVVYEGESGPGKGKHIVFVSGDEEYHSEEVLPALAQILARHHGFKCTVLFAIDPETGIVNPRVRDNIPGLETLETADMMVIFTRWRILPDEQTQHIADFVKTGKPIVGLRTATHAIAPPTQAHQIMRTWLRLKKRNPEKAGPRPVIPQELWGPYGHLGDGYWGPNKKWAGGFGKFIIGEMWVAHHGMHKHESTVGIVAPGAKKHPVLRGIKSGDIWGSTDVYTIDLPLPGDSKPLVLGKVMARKGDYDATDVNYGMRPSDGPPVAEKNEPMMPVAWTKTYQDKGGKKGRVFATTMGSAADFDSAALRKLIVNGVYWAFRLEAKIPQQGAKVEFVGKFSPSQYGFTENEYWVKRNLRPSDFAW
jgi:type 1 glutamine amidotransferase